MKNHNTTARGAAGALPLPQPALPLLTRSLISSLALSLVLTPMAVQAQGAPASPAPTTRFEYDAEGNPTRIVQGQGSLNLASRMAYDKLQRLIQQFDPLNAETLFSYNGREDLTEVRDARWLSTRYTLDGLGQRFDYNNPDTQRTVYTYDAAGNLTSKQDSDLVKTNYSYDALNRLTQAQYQQGVPAGTTPPPPLLHNWTYDQTGAGFSHGVGRLTTTSFPAGSRKYAYDAQGRLTQATQALSQAGRSHTATVGYAYNAAGQLTQLSYPSGRVLSLTHEDGLPKALSITLTPGGAAQGILQDLRWAAWSQVGGGAQVQGWNWNLDSGLKSHERGFDEWGRLVSYPLGPYQRSLGYDAADRITGYTHTQAGSPAPALDQAFSYDGAGRLTRAQVGAKIWTYSYDATGNRKTHSTPTVASGTYTTQGWTNRLTKVSNPSLSSFLYANTGGMKWGGGTWTATYAVSGPMASLTKGTVITAYEYDTDARRVIKSSGSAATSAVYGQGGELLGEYNMVTGQAIREYVWLGSTPVAMIATAQGSSTPELFLLHADHIDTPRVATDRQGRTRWTWMAEPFGNELATEKPDAALAALTNPLRFPGQVFDSESGLHYNHHRYYDPRIGRYVQSDPIGLGGGINTYTYVSGDPVSKVDPSGLWECRTTGLVTVCRRDPPPVIDPRTDSVRKPEDRLTILNPFDWVFKNQKPRWVTGKLEKYWDAAQCYEGDPCQQLKDYVRQEIQGAKSKQQAALLDEKTLFRNAYSTPNPSVTGSPTTWVGHIRDLDGRVAKINEMIGMGQRMGCDMSAEIAMTNGLYVPNAPLNP